MADSSISKPFPLQDGNAADKADIHGAFLADAGFLKAEGKLKSAHKTEKAVAAGRRDDDSTLVPDAYDTERHKVVDSPVRFLNDELVSFERRVKLLANGDMSLNDDDAGMKVHFKRSFSLFSPSDQGSWTARKISMRGANGEWEDVPADIKIRADGAKHTFAINFQGLDYKVAIDRSRGDFQMHMGDVVLSGDRKSYGAMDTPDMSVKVDLNSIDKGFTYRDKVRGFSVSPLLDDNLRIKYDDGREEVRKLALTNSRGKEFEVLWQEDRNIRVRRSDGRVGTLSFDKSDNQIYFTYAEPGKHKGAAGKSDKGTGPVYREEPLVADGFTKDVLAARLMVSSLLPEKADK